MNDDAARDLLIALSLLPFLTPNRTRLLLEHCVPLESVSHCSSLDLQELLRLTPAEIDQVKNPLTSSARTRVAALRNAVVTLGDAEYPALLREIADPPLVLHVRGDTSALAGPALAIVGSRRASPYGINAAEHLSRQLAAAGLTIVSGLARGVDAAAHAACLEAGRRTIAVLGTGIDVIYPRSNTRLFRRIEEEGLILSEFPPGTPPRPENFPIRNRVISGLTLGAIIVEATRRSGSLITARMAAEQGREVFAVPGPIFSAGAEGAHRLIQSGAKLVHDAGDVVDELPAALGLRLPGAGDAPAPGSPRLRELLALFDRSEPLHVDAIPARTRSTPGEIAASLLELELGGWIRALPGGRYIRAT